MSKIKLIFRRNSRRKLKIAIKQEFLDVTGDPNSSVKINKQNFISIQNLLHDRANLLLRIKQ